MIFSKTILHTVQSKRDVLKSIASIYDPCGFAVPIILPAKLFFQKLWKIKTKWDDQLNDNLLIEWEHIASKFTYIQKCHIDRHFAQGIENDNEMIEYELHCYTDSSKDAYAAVIYLRSSLHTNNMISFVIDKSRLVPIKEQNNLQIPKLELLGALIGCRLLNYAIKFLRIKIKAQFLWTDSQIVLSWYKSEKLLPPFVARRINEIKLNKTLQIRYVPSKLNPADVGTRVERIDSFSRWLIGPEFLAKNAEQWPTYPNCTEIVHTQISSSVVGLSKEVIFKDNTTFDSDQTKGIVEDKPVDSEIREILEI